MVQVTGSYSITFHNTASTSKVLGIHADNDTMNSGGVYMFVSTGTNALGLTAS